MLIQLMALSDTSKYSAAVVEMDENVNHCKVRVSNGDRDLRATLMGILDMAVDIHPNSRRYSAELTEPGPRSVACTLCTLAQQPRHLWESTWSGAS